MKIQTSSSKWLAFIGITLLSFGCYLDYTIVNIALPNIQQQFHVNLATLQWIMNIYFLALCALAAIMGRCGDIYGRRRLFYIGGFIFAVASLIAGFAWDFNALLIGRLLQGIGAAIILPIGPSLLPSSFPEKEHVKAISWLGSLGGVALALGPVLGGVIVTQWGWRWIFFINLPIAILGYLFCFVAVKESDKVENTEALDWVGMLFLAITVSGIVVGLIYSEEYGWKNIITLLFLLIGSCSAIILFLIEIKKKNPLIDFKDFSKLLFYAASSLILLAGMLSSVALFFDPLYLQILRGQSPQLSGLILFAIPIAVFGIAFIVGSLIKRLGLIKVLILGLSLGVIATFLQIFFNSNTSLYFIIFAFLILGSQWALGNTVSIIAAQKAVPPSRASVATGTIVTLFNLGGSIGLALSVVIYHAVSNYSLNSILPKFPLAKINIEMLKNLILTPANSLQMKMDATSHHLFTFSFIRGFSGVMFFMFIFSLLLLSIIIFWLINKPHKKIT